MSRRTQVEAVFEALEGRAEFGTLRDALAAAASLNPSRRAPTSVRRMFETHLPLIYRGALKPQGGVRTSSFS